MASIKISGDTSGEITISAPAVAGTNTLTLPASTGTLAQTTTGLIEIDMFRLTTDVTAPNGLITSNLERCDEPTFAKIGTGMSLSSGVFTFPRTGLYNVTVQASFQASADNVCFVNTQITTDNSSYTTRAEATGGDDQGTNTAFANGFSQLFVNVTDTTNIKVQFACSSFVSPSILRGDSNKNETSFSFIRLGDSQ